MRAAAPDTVCVLLVGMLLSGAPSPVLAQDGGALGAIVLELPTATRALAMGGAATAAEQGDAAIFFNPARLMGRPGENAAPSAGASVQRYLASSTLAAASAVMPLGRGMLGVGLQLLDYGSEAEIVPDPDFDGERGVATGNRISASEYAVTAGYAVGFGRSSIGVAGKFVHQQLVDVSGSAAAFDVGASTEVGGYVLGAAIRNVGTDLEVGTQSAPLPSQLRFGVLREMRLGAQTTGAFSADLLRTRGTKLVPAFGAEVGVQVADRVQLLGRAGYAVRDSDDAVRPLNVGFALRSASLTMEYAYQGFELVAGATHRLGVRWRR